MINVYKLFNDEILQVVDWCSQDSCGSLLIFLRLFLVCVCVFACCGLASMHNSGPVYTSVGLCHFGNFSDSGQVLPMKCENIIDLCLFTPIFNVLDPSTR